MREKEYLVFEFLLGVVGGVELLLDVEFVGLGGLVLHVDVVGDGDVVAIPAEVVLVVVPLFGEEVAGVVGGGEDGLVEEVELGVVEVDGGGEEALDALEGGVVHGLGGGVLLGLLDLGGVREDLLAVVLLEVALAALAVVLEV